MDYIVIWSPRALDDVDDIAAYIAQDSEVYASAVVRNILRTVRTLSMFPFRGRVVPEFDDDSIREVFVYSYRIIYKIEESEVTIAAVIHGSRLLELAIRP
ncbi:MAG: type II toxin-antitoxin system RelE/ParE family toxin [Acidobacteria bacterium]|nr:type II toxin-antitoxin system RelE/ParE family toxin [Acidobacteriota bacterium]